MMSPKEKQEGTAVDDLGFGKVHEVLQHYVWAQKGTQ